SRMEDTVAANRRSSRSGAGTSRLTRYFGSSASSAATGAGRNVLPRRRPKKASVERRRRVSSVMAEISGGHRLLESLHQIRPLPCKGAVPAGLAPEVTVGRGL